MKFARVVFYGAGIYGFVSLVPLYFMFDLIGRKDPPPITHPQFYYGFIGLALAWQVAFLAIASNPVPFRPVMIASVIEKLSYVATVAVLDSQGRLSHQQAFTALPDLLLGMLFIVSFLKTPRTG
jgi:hypothetical protein